MEWNYAFVHLESGRDIRREKVGSRRRQVAAAATTRSHESQGVCAMPNHPRLWYRLLSAQKRG